MRSAFLAAMLAAFFAATAASPMLAADRPVGPETGQARSNIGDEHDNYGPDEDPSPHGGVDPNELGWNSDAMIRWMQWYERNVGPIGF